nr:hypothetical protein Iba_chr02fCG7450 [Ipomoea batatas]
MAKKDPLHPKAALQASKKTAVSETELQVIYKGCCTMSQPYPEMQQQSFSPSSSSSDSAYGLTYTSTSIILISSCIRVEGKVTKHTKRETKYRDACADGYEERKKEAELLTFIIVEDTVEHYLEHYQQWSITILAR